MGHTVLNRPSSLTLQKPGSGLPASLLGDLLSQHFPASSIKRSTCLRMRRLRHRLITQLPHGRWRLDTPGFQQYAGSGCRRDGYQEED